MPYHDLKIDDFATIVANDLKRTHKDFQLIKSRPSNTPVLPYFDVDTELELAQVANLTNITSNAYSVIILNETITKRLITDEEPSYELTFTADGTETLVVYTKMNDNFVYYSVYDSIPIQNDLYHTIGMDIISYIK